MANTFTKIATYTVGSGGVTTFTFSSIPQTYTDLCVKISDRGNRSSTFYSNAGVKINNDSSAIYDWKWNRDYAGTAASLSATNDTEISWYDAGTSGDASTFSSTELYFSNYTSSLYKPVSMENIVEQNGTNCFIVMGGYIYRSTNAITSLTFDGSPNNYTLQQYSSFTLYGIKNS